MHIVPGYTITEVLLERGGSTVLRGRKGERHVMLRVPSHDLPGSDEIARLRYGYAISRSLDLPGVVKVLGIEGRRSNLVLVMEDFGAQPLRALMGEERLPVIDAIQIAVELSSVLGELHQAHVTHKAIEPSNVFINPRTKQIKIGNFDNASLLTRENAAPISASRLEGALAYISPEQTGRMNRALDYRTDFYSLGVTLYELLTGQLPFRVADPMALVHSHIALSPEPPDRLRPAIPRAISALVMKLLAKNAEDRYQSAYGLTADLKRCLEHLEPASTIPEFELGERDTSAGFQIPQKLYGREGDKARLLDTFDRVQRGATELMLVTGYSGVGKSALVNEIHKPIVEQRGYYSSGKFDELQNIPYAGLIRALQDLIRQILAESEEKVAAWKDILLDALGANAQIVIDVIPEVALIVGEQPPAAPLGPSESQNRFRLVFQRFIGALAAKERPLALFLDDLQWADVASLKLIELILQDPDGGHLLLICAYRDNEVGPAHPLAITLGELTKAGARIDEIKLTPLDAETVTELVADTLSSSRENVEPLAKLVFEKTRGNPFFLSQFLAALHNDRLLAFDARAGAWSWNLKAIQDQVVTDNVVALMTSKLARLAPETQRALKLAACIGHTFDLRTLATICEQTEPETAAELWESLSEGLVVPLDAEYRFLYAGGAPGARLDRDSDTDIEASLESRGPGFNVSYKFLHDRVQQAAYSLIEEGQRQEVHLRVGRLLRSRGGDTPRDDDLFEVVNHMNFGVALIADPAERLSLARLNLLAGKRAKSATAYEAAAAFLATGMALQGGEASWEREYDLAFAIHAERAECEYLRGQFGEAESLFDVLLAHARTDLERARVHNQRLVHYTTLGKFGEALAIGRTALALFGIDLPESEEARGAAMGAELALVQKNLGDRRVEDLIHSPALTDPEKTVVLELVTSLSAPAYLLSPILYVIVVAKQVNISLEYGHSKVSAYGYMAYGSILAAILGQYQAAYAFGRLALDLNEKLANVDLECKLCFLFAYFSHFVKPLRTTMPYLERGYHAGLESGDFPYLSYISLQTLANRFNLGHELSAVREEADKLLSLMQRTKDAMTTAFLTVGKQMVQNLTGKTKGRRTLSDDGFDEVPFVEMMETAPFPFAAGWYYTVKLELLYLYEDYEGALAMAVQVEKWIMACVGQNFTTDLALFACLTLQALFTTATPEDKERYSAMLEANRAKLATWAGSCPENYEHKHLLVLAEDARVAGDDTKALGLYDQAIAAAEKNGFLHHQALGNELAAKFHLGVGRTRIASFYMSEAHDDYARWGATAKADDLEERYPHLLKSAADGAAERRDAGEAQGDSFDLTTVLKASQAISGEIVLADLLRKLMSTLLENAGAQRGLLILRGDRPFLVAADTTTGGDGALVLETAPAEGRSDIARAVVRYVERTHESVVLGDAASSGPFQADPYIARSRPKSILCLPVMHQKKLAGILYLENNLVTDAFTPERCRVLELLSAQAAISLENARLYDTLDNRVKERTRELSSALDRLKDTQKQLIMQEKLASLGILTSGIAHEIKNPLNFVNNFAELSVGLSGELREEVGRRRAALGVEGAAYMEEVIGDLAQNVAKIHEHGKRADGIVTAMLEHARGGMSGEPREIDLNALLKEYVGLAIGGAREKGAGAEVTIEASYDPQLSPVYGAPEDIGRVILNLVNNARYAALHRRNTDGAAFSPTIRVSTRDAGERVEIRIWDNGGGVPAAIRDKIWTPFFTTKPAGEGTGLGLSISYDIIVQGNGGTLTLETEEGVCSTFIVGLPKHKG